MNKTLIYRPYEGELVTDAVYNSDLFGALCLAGDSGFSYFGVGGEYTSLLAFRTTHDKDAALQVAYEILESALPQAVTFTFIKYQYAATGKAIDDRAGDTTGIDVCAIRRNASASAMESGLKVYETEWYLQIQTLTHDCKPTPSKTEAIEAVVKHVYEALVAIGVTSERVDASRYVNLARRMLGQQEVGGDLQTYDENRLLCDQILNEDTAFYRENHILRIASGNHTGRCVSTLMLKSLPEQNYQGCVDSAAAAGLRAARSNDADVITTISHYIEAKAESKDNRRSEASTERKLAIGVAFAAHSCEGAGNAANVFQKEMRRTDFLFFQESELRMPVLLACVPCAGDFKALLNEGRYRTVDVRDAAALIPIFSKVPEGRGNGLVVCTSDAMVATLDISAVETAPVTTISGGSDDMSIHLFAALAEIDVRSNRKTILVDCNGYLPGFSAAHKIRKVSTSSSANGQFGFVPSGGWSPVAVQTLISVIQGSTVATEEGLGEYSAYELRIPHKVAKMLCKENVTKESNQAIADYLNAAPCRNLTNNPPPDLRGGSAVVDLSHSCATEQHEAIAAISTLAWVISEANGTAHDSDLYETTIYLTSHNWIAHVSKSFLEELILALKTLKTRIVIRSEVETAFHNHDWYESLTERVSFVLPHQERELRHLVDRTYAVFGRAGIDNICSLKMSAKRYTEVFMASGSSSAKFSMAYVESLAALYREPAEVECDDETVNGPVTHKKRTKETRKKSLMGLLKRGEVA